MNAEGPPKVLPDTRTHEQKVRDRILLHQSRIHLVQQMRDAPGFCKSCLNTSYVYPITTGTLEEQKDALIRHIEGRIERLKMNPETYRDGDVDTLIKWFGEYPQTYSDDVVFSWCPDCY